MQIQEGSVKLKVSPKSASFVYKSIHEDSESIETLHFPSASNSESR